LARMPLPRWRPGDPVDLEAVFGYTQKQRAFTHERAGIRYLKLALLSEPDSRLPLAERELERAVAMWPDRMRAIGLKPPTHSRNGLPKMASRFGYGQLERALQALEGGKPLPRQAENLRQQIRKAHKQPAVTVSPTVISALGFDAKGYYRCANCGRFASQTRGHVCPMTANSRELAAMLQRRTGISATAFGGYKTDPLEDLLTEARKHGDITMMHALTGQAQRVTLDGIPLALQNGFVPIEWTEHAQFVLAEHRDGSVRVIPVLDAEGLTRAEEASDTVQALAQAYGWQPNPQAPYPQSIRTLTKNGLRYKMPVLDSDSVQLAGGQAYDLGHFIGTEFRKASARGALVTLGGKQYGVYARSKNPADRSSARGRFAPEVEDIVIGRTLPAAVEMLRTGSVSMDPDGRVQLYRADGSLAAVYDPATRAAGDTAGNPNASPEQMAAVLAWRMQNPQNAFDLALARDFAAFRQYADRIVEQVDQHSFDLDRIKGKRRNIRINISGKFDMFMSFPVENQGVFDNGRKVAFFLSDPWHTGKIGKFTHQPFNLVNLGNNGRSTLVKYGLVVGYGVQITLAKSLCRQLDRGERVFDLMGDTAGHFLPGGKPLRFFQVGQVVEHDDIADGCSFVVKHSGYINQQGQGLAGTNGQTHVAFNGMLFCFVQFPEKIFKNQNMGAG